MSKTFYSDYVNHCIRFYIRHPHPKYHSSADKENWLVCDKALNSFSDKDRHLLLAVYSTEGDNLADSVNQVSQDRNVRQETIWKVVNELERKIAKRRGLL